MDPTTPQVLFADDDAAMRELMRAFFKRVGWEARVVKDGNEAVQSVSERSFDVVITDLKMPGLDGLQLLKWIHGSNPGQAVIVVTGAGTVVELLEILREGASDVIQKPLDLDSLEKSVTRVISGKRQRQFERDVLRHMKSERSEYRFSCADIIGQKVPLFIAERLHCCGAIDLNCKLKLELAFQEALTNSVEHGNLELESSWKETIDAEGFDRYSRVKRERLGDERYAQRGVTVSLDFDGTKLIIAIRDEGSKEWAPPEQLEKRDPTACYGRGLAIMRAAMDEVRFSEGGRCVTLVKYLGDGK